MIKSSPSLSQEDSMKPDEIFHLKNVFAAFAGLPRVTRLVWSASPALTMSMVAVTCVNGLMPLANAVIARLLLDSVIQAFVHRAFSLVLVPVCFQLAVNLLSRVCDASTALLQPLLQDRVADHIQVLILRKANTLDLAFFEKPEFHEKLYHAAEEGRSKPFMMIMQTFNMVRSVITLISLLGLLFHLAWWLVVVALLIPLPSFIANSRYGFKDYWITRRQSAEKLQQLYVIRVLTSDDFAKEIKLFDLGDFFIQRYQKFAEKFYRENKNLQLPRNIAGLLWSMLSVIANSGIYLYIALRAVSGYISFGGMSQYSMAINQMGYSVQGVLDGIADLHENSLFANTIFEFLAYQPAIVLPETPVPLEVISERKALDIEFRDVSFTYPGRKQPILDHVSFIVNAGETVALVGHNGAGKTTLVKLLTRLYDPDEGDILIGGRNIKEYDPRLLRAQMGVIFQDYAKYAFSAQENIGVGSVANIENFELVQAAAQKSGADAVINRLNDGYSTILGKWITKGAQLSGGEWQKVALARAFIRDARLLILDEPTSALDPQTEYDVFTRFLQLIENKTAIFISHRFSTARLADRIFVIEHGRIIESGSHVELMDMNGVYAELYSLQAEAYR